MREQEGKGEGRRESRERESECWRRCRDGSDTMEDYLLVKSMS